MNKSVVLEYVSIGKDGRVWDGVRYAIKLAGEAEGEEGCHGML